MNLIPQQSRTVRTHSRAALIEAIGKVMRKHATRRRAISKRDIFIEVFGNPRRFSVLDLHMISKEMDYAFNALRKTATCTLVSDYFDGERLYYIATTMDELSPYIDRLQKNIKGCKYMIKHMTKKVEKKKFHQYLQGDTNVKRLT